VSAILNANLDVFKRVIGFTPNRRAESHLLFSNPVPMEYSLKDRSDEVIVTHFDNISQI